MEQNDKNEEPTGIDPRIRAFLMPLARRHYGALDKKDRDKFIEKFGQIKTNEDAVLYAQWLYKKIPEITQNEMRFRKKKLDLLCW